MSKGTRADLREAQFDWARGRKVSIDKDGYCTTLEDNLFQPMTACSRADFEAADGSELGKEGERGKLQAVHSSSALACNVFDYWRGRDLGVLQSALGLVERPCSIRLEARFRTGLKGKPANLDVLLTGSSGRITAIESKFTEPFSGGSSKNRFKPKYFEKGRKHWTDRGLQPAQQLAEALQDGSLKFKFLDAGQLLKHCLGLARSEQPWELLYLWFDASDDDSGAHQEEVATCLRALDGMPVRAMTYQGFFRKLQTAVSGHADYLQYLDERYFTAT